MPWLSKTVSAALSTTLCMFSSLVPCDSCWGIMFAWGMTLIFSFIWVRIVFWPSAEFTSSYLSIWAWELWSSWIKSLNFGDNKGLLFWSYWPKTTSYLPKYSSEVYFFNLWIASWYSKNSSAAASRRYSLIDPGTLLLLRIDLGMNTSLFIFEFIFSVFDWSKNL